MNLYVAAQDIQVVTIVVPNPQYNPSNNAQVVSVSLTLHVSRVGTHNF